MADGLPLLPEGGRTQYPTKGPSSLLVSSDRGVKNVSRVLLGDRWRSKQRGKLLRLVGEAATPVAAGICRPVAQSG